jgi:malonyl-CoA O-methyltransferase
VNPVDKRRVGLAFSRGAATYDEHAHLQRGAADRLVGLALPVAGAVRSLLDVGSGTGSLLARMGGILPGAALAGVDLAPGMAGAARERAPEARLAVGDAEALPFRAASFDLVLSTSTLQWLPRLEPAFAEARRVLTPGGTLGVALFGGETLWELRRAWRAALPSGAPDGLHRFHAAAAVRAALLEAGLAPLHLESERVVERHAHPLDLLRSLRSLGAGNATPGGTAAGRGLGARAALVRMASAYLAAHDGPDGVPATWEIVYALARKPPTPG